MERSETRTAPYKVIADVGGNRYRFFCERSGMALCTTSPFCADNQEEELLLAWEEEGRQNFNLCGKCGRWVSDVMFNLDTGECVFCSPWEEDSVFCPRCGALTSAAAELCRKCGAPLRRERRQNGS